MYISRINNYSSPKVNFGRKLTKNEEQDYKNNGIKPAFDYLGIKEVAMILHGTSYPESRLFYAPHINNDIGVGTPYGKVAAQLMPFELLHGFNSNQLGPIGELNSRQKFSPYESSVGAKNYLFIDFNKLTENDYAHLLQTSDITGIVSPVKKNDKNYAYSDFPDAFANYNHLIKKAYSNFNNKIEHGDSRALKMSKEFSQFMNSHPEIETYALFNILKDIYGTDDFTKWKEIDRNLPQNLRNEDDYDAHFRKEQLRLKTDTKYEEYCFAQYILDKQIKENTAFRKEIGFKYISDMLVGFSPADEWAHQDLFLKDYRIGCPYGGPYGGIQKWNVPILDPKKLFNPDGSLGSAGEYLKAKLEDALTNFDNVRIDHVLGLVDPFIYSKSGHRQGNINDMPDIDPDKNYQKVLNKIILPTLEEHGIDKNSPVWEDLVTETPTFNRIYYQENGLSGITPLEYKKGEDYRNTKNWFLVGSHDSDPAHKMIKKDWVRNNEAWQPMYLAGVLNASSDSREYCNKIAHDDNERVKAKFAELFMMGDKIQISFADFFGIDKTYNEGGHDENPNNWKLRLNNDYEDTYYKNLSSEHPTAINMPEILKMAVKGKAEMKIAHGQDPEKVWNDADEILFTLNKYDQILKEK